MPTIDPPLPRATAFFLACVPLVAIGVAGCVADATEADAGEAVAAREEAWDSQAGNPTHATHAYLTEHAIAQVAPRFPEVATYRAALLDGANQELHELRVSDARKEALRVAAAGTNWACDRPEVVWARARALYAAGDKRGAYEHVGILLHYVEDMGVPAHAFHVVHQGTLAERDNFEILGLQRWAPRFDATANDPALALPSDYVAFSGGATRQHFADAFPGHAYTTKLFAMSWLWTPRAQARFVEEREGRTATVAAWALASAAAHL